MKVYYAHSMHLYGKPQEKRDIELLKRMGFEVVNPSESVYEEKCREIKSKNTDRDLASALIMDYFMEVVAGCDVVAFRAHPDGRIPSGVGKEVKKGIELNKPIIELPVLLDSRFMGINETRHMLELLGER